MPQDRLTSRLVPAVLGVASAVLLGGAGFGLGCLYAIALPPAVTVAAMPASTPGVGGPEEPAPAITPAVARPAPVFRAISPTPGGAGPFGATLAMDRPVAGGWVSSHFGRRADPFTGRPAVHRGLDFAGLDNSAILAVAPGVVTWSGRQRGYGNLIEIDHGRGWVTRYGHNASNLVAVGDYVKPGQMIALMGATGRATGTHLHFEVLYRGRHQNPARFVPQDT